MTVRVQVTGVVESQAKLDRIIKETVRKLGNEMVKESREMLLHTQAEVPIEDHDLVMSGQVSPLTFPDSRTMEVLISYGGPSVKDAGRGYDYAKIQHERDDYAHPGGGKSRFLKDPVEAHGRSVYPQRMTAAALAVLSRHVK